ncbi:MAG: SecDF P1 head subdomain-containing protein [Acetivibrionales bacterium]
MEKIGRTALLTFQEVDEDKVDSDGKYLPTGKIIIQGTDVLDATAVMDSNTGRTMVALDLSSEAKTKFADATKRLVGRPIAIFMDDDFISAPIVQEHITDGNAVITLGGDKSAKDGSRGQGPGRYNKGGRFAVQACSETGQGNKPDARQGSA